MIQQLISTVYNTDYYFRKGTRLLNEGLYDQAVLPLNKAKHLAMERQHDDVEYMSRIFLARGKAFIGGGQSMLAKADLEKSCRLNPSNREAQALLAGIA